MKKLEFKSKRALSVRTCRSCSLLASTSTNRSSCASMPTRERRRRNRFRWCRRWEQELTESWPRRTCWWAYRSCLYIACNDFVSSGIAIASTIDVLNLGTSAISDELFILKLSLFILNSVRSLLDYSVLVFRDASFFDLDNQRLVDWIRNQQCLRLISHRSLRRIVADIGCLKSRLRLLLHR